MSGNTVNQARKGAEMKRKSGLRGQEGAVRGSAWCLKGDKRLAPTIQNERR